MRIEKFDDFKRCAHTEEAIIKDVHKLLREALPLDGDRVIEEIERVCEEKRKRDTNVNHTGWKFVIIEILRRASNGHNTFSKAALECFLDKNELGVTFFSHHTKSILNSVFKNALGFENPDFKKRGNKTDTWTFNDEIKRRYFTGCEILALSEDELTRRALNYHAEKRYPDAKKAFLELGRFYYEIEKIEKAIEVYVKALELYPGDDDIVDGFLELTDDEYENQRQRLQELYYSPEIQEQPLIRLISGFLDNLISPVRFNKAAEFLKHLIKIDLQESKDFIVKYAQLYFRQYSGDASDFNYDEFIHLVSSILQKTEPDVYDFSVFSQIHMLRYYSAPYRYIFELYGPVYFDRFSKPPDVFITMKYNEFMPYIESLLHFKLKKYESAVELLEKFEEDQKRFKRNGKSAGIIYFRLISNELCSIASMSCLSTQIFIPLWLECKDIIEIFTILSIKSDGMKPGEVDWFGIGFKNDYKLYGTVLSRLSGVYEYYNRYIQGKQEEEKKVAASFILLCGCYYALGIFDRARKILEQLDPEYSPLIEAIRARFAELALPTDLKREKPYGPLGKF